MALNSPEKIAKAKELLQKSEAHLATLKSDDPNYARVSGVVNSARSQINAYESSNRPPDGKIKENLPDPTGGTYEVKGTDPYSYDQFYEPSLESVRNRVANDRNLRERLGLPEFSGPRGSETVAQDAINQALFQQGGLQQYPSIDTLDENSSVYKAVAEDDWNQAANKAKEEGKSLRRYSKIALKEEPIEKAAGFIGKHVPGFAASAYDTLNPFSRFSRENDRNSVLQPKPGYSGVPDESVIQERKDRTPMSTVGAIGASAAPVAIGNQAVGAVMKAGNYAARSPIGKSLIGGVGGALGSVVEGELQAAGEEYGSEDPSFANYVKGADERITGNAVMGFGLGWGGDLVSQASKTAQRVIHESPRMEDVRKLEAAGGNTHVLKGVKIPENVQRNISEAGRVGAIGRPEDLAAARVAPKISEYVDKQAQATYEAAGENLKKYHASPEGIIPQRIAAPVKTMIQMIKQGLNRGDLGTVADANPTVAHNLRKKLASFVERKEVSLAQFDAMKARYGDDIIEMDPVEADELFGVKTTQNEKPTTFPNADEQVLRDAHGKRIYVDPEEAANYAAGRSPFKNPFRASDGRPVQSPDGLTPPADNLLSEGQSLLGEGTIATPTEGLSVAGESNPFNLPAMQTPIPSIYPVRDPPHLIEQKNYLTKYFGQGKASRLNEQRKLLGMANGEFADIKPGGEPSFPSSSGPNTKTVLVPRSYNSQQLEEIQQSISDEIRNSKEHKGWLKTLDKSFREVRDRFAPNANTPIGEKLDDGTELTGLSALQHAHQRAFDKLTQVKTDTSADYGSAIHNKVRAFNTGGNFAADKELMEQAKQIDKNNSQFSLADKTLRDLGHRDVQPEKLEAVRNDKEFLATGRSAGDKTGISLIVDPEEGIKLTDGRHRFTVAKEVGLNEIYGTVRDPESGAILFQGNIPLNKISGPSMEQQLYEVTGSAVGPSLKERSLFGGPQGMFQGAKDFASFRADPILRAIGNVEPNPFTAPPNSPAARIQKYLFEDAAKNMLNLQGGRLGRFGNEINDERNSQ